MLRKILLTCLSALLLCGLGEAALAQKATPFIDPDYFDPDFQFFAPADVEEYGDDPEYSIGWFFTWDRAYMNASRAAGQLRPWEGDFAWGNRFELGYMTNDDHGWLVTVWHIDGPNIQEPLLLEFGEADFHAFDLLKTFRRELHNGAILEPFVGFRFSTFTEHYSDRDAVLNALNQQIGTNDIVNGTENSMWGGVLGVRGAKQTGHWILSGDARLFAAVNFQYNEFVNVFTPNTGLILQDVLTSTREQFVMAVDTQVNAEYIVTRDVSLRVGFQLMHYGRGVGRVAQTYEDDQNFTAAGVTFGLAINR